MSEDLNDIVADLADRYSVPPAHLHALVEVESGGKAFTDVKDRFGQVLRFPLYRHEGHYFHKLLKGAALAAAVAAGLASPKAQAVANPSSQQARFTKLFEPACAIDRGAAISSASWGVGQVMGAHFRDLGFGSADDFYRHAGTLGGQLDLVVRFIRSAGLLDELQRGDWTGLARGYNGPNFRKFKYDTKLAAAAKRYGGQVLDGQGMLQLGSSGPRVRELQRLLERAGFSVKADGDFGPSTRSAVQRFQKAAAVEVDGRVGPETMERLRRYRQAAGEDLTKVRLAELPNVGKIATTVISASGISQAKGQLETAADQIGQAATSFGADAVVGTMLQHAVGWLTAGAGILGVAAIGWAAWEWAKSQRSYTGVPA